MNRYNTLALCIVMLLPLSGCDGFKKHEDTETRVIQPPEWEYMLVFLIDPSQSFLHKKWDAPAHDFLVGTVENYFRGRSEPEDRVLLAALSDRDDSPLLWQGTPMALKQRFDSPDTLRNFVAQYSTPTKRVYASLAKTLNYASELPPIRNRTAKVVVVVLSDMLDESKTKEQDLTEAGAALKRLLALRSEIGFWWVDSKAHPDVQKWYREAGLPEPYFQYQEDRPKPLTFE